MALPIPWERRPRLALVDADAWQILIAVLALVVAAVTLYFVVLDRLERARGLSRPLPMATGWATLNGSDTATHRVWLENAGGATVRIVTMLPRGFDFAMLERPLPKVLPVGDRVPIEIRTDDFDAAWMHMLWQSSDDSRFLFVTWIALRDDGALDHAQVDEYAEYVKSAPRWGWLRRRRERGRRVGPGELARRTLRYRHSGKREVRMQAEIAAAITVGEPEARA